MELPTEGKRAVIFDLDGTLYNRRHLPFRLIVSDPMHLRLLGSERQSRKELAGQWFGEEKAYYDALFRKMSLSAHTSTAEAERWYNDRYMPLMQRILRRHYRVEPWVGTLLPRLRQEGKRVAVYSDYGCVRERLEAVGFDLGWADIVADAPKMGGLKPCREALLNLCRLLDAAPEETLMVGDRDDTDGEGARRCGMTFYHLTL